MASDEYMYIYIYIDILKTLHVEDLLQERRKLESSVDALDKEITRSGSSGAQFLPPL